MQRTIRIVCALFFLAFVISALSQNRPATNVSPEQNCDDSDKQLISALNDRIQERFKDVDNGFGYRRITKPGETPHRFTPENVKELQAVSDLKKSNLQIALYLAGRDVLGSKPVNAQLDKGLRRLIDGPVLITPANRQNAGLPKPLELWEQSRKALTAFRTSDVHDFTVGKWKFTARPVRATDESCLKCHAGDKPYDSPNIRPVGEDQQGRRLRIGDPLGVVLYVYQHER